MLTETVRRSRHIPELRDYPMKAPLARLLRCLTLLSAAVGGSALRLLNVEPMTGIEPAYSAWEADVLPLNYIGMCR